MLERNLSADRCSEYTFVVSKKSPADSEGIDGRLKTCCELCEAGFSVPIFLLRAAKARLKYDVNFLLRSETEAKN